MVKRGLTLFSCVFFSMPIFACDMAKVTGLFEGRWLDIQAGKTYLEQWQGSGDVLVGSAAYLKAPRVFKSHYVTLDSASKMLPSKALPNKALSRKALPDQDLISQGKSDNGLFSSIESMLIAPMRGELIYFAKVAHNPLPIAFKASYCSPHKVVFSNKEHDFPTRIAYQLQNQNTLTVRVSDESEKGFTLTLRRFE